MIHNRYLRDNVFSKTLVLAHAPAYSRAPVAGSRGVRERHSRGTTSNFEVLAGASSRSSSSRSSAMVLEVEDSVGKPDKNPHRECEIKHLESARDASRYATRSLIARLSSIRPKSPSSFVLIIHCRGRHDSACRQAADVTTPPSLFLSLEKERNRERERERQRERERERERRGGRRERADGRRDEKKRRTTVLDD